MAGLVTIGHHGGLAVFGAVVASLVVNIGLFVVAFRLLTPKQIPWSDMMPGAFVGAAGWTILQYLGGVLVEHSLRNTSKEYGTFALVLGLLAFLYLAAQVTLYASELNVVRARHLWPRGLVQPPLTAADKKVLSSIALEGQRRPEQYVTAGFQADSGATERAARDAVTRFDVASSFCLAPLGNSCGSAGACRGGVDDDRPHGNPGCRDRDDPGRRKCSRHWGRMSRQTANVSWSDCPPSQCQRNRGRYLTTSVKQSEKQGARLMRSFGSESSRSPCPCDPEPNGVIP